VLRLTASEAERHFSAVLGRVAAGEEIEVVRDGAAVAVIAPPPHVQAERIGIQFRSAPSGASSFADDLRILEAELEAPPSPPG
jgi:prevent-host-death family protein